MSRNIGISFDQRINGYIVKFPDFVELDVLKKAKKNFGKLLKNEPRMNFSLLFDTGAHEFESIECLKYIRELLSIKLLVDNCEIFASVAPESHAQAEVKSDKEALFNEYFVAYE